MKALFIAALFAQSSAIAGDFAGLDCLAIGISRSNPLGEYFTLQEDQRRIRIRQNLEEAHLGDLVFSAREGDAIQLLSSRRRSAEKVRKFILEKKDQEFAILIQVDMTTSRRGRNFGEVILLESGSTAVTRIAHISCAAK